MPELKTHLAFRKDIGETLLCANSATNFIYRIENMPIKYVDSVNSINTRWKMLNRIKMICEKGGKLIFEKLESSVFEENISLIDSKMGIILSEMLNAYYSGKAKRCGDLVGYVAEVNLLSQLPKFYVHNVKNLLLAISIGMKPSEHWNGINESFSEYRFILPDKEELVFNAFALENLKEYLLNSTRFESSSTARNKFGTIYTDNNVMYIKLNLQIRLF